MLKLELLLTYLELLFLQTRLSVTRLQTALKMICAIGLRIGRRVVGGIGRNFMNLSGKNGSESEAILNSRLMVMREDSSPSAC